MGDVASQEDHWEWRARFGPRGNLREAVAVFNTEKELQEAVDDLECHGFSHAALSRPAGYDDIEQVVSTHQVRTIDLEDDARIPRTAYIDPDSRTSGVMIMIVVPVYVALLVAIAVAASNNFSVFGMITLAVVLGLIAGSIGYYFSRGVARRSRERLEAERAAGGLLLWVRTGSVKQDKDAVRILRRHGGRHVHLHGPSHK